MKQGFIYMVFVVDESSSMTFKAEEIIGSFNKFLDDQCNEKEGKTECSLYTFNSYVRRIFEHKDVHEVKKLDNATYVPFGLTCLNDALCQAIDETGDYLASLPEEERPSQVMVIVMTDGFENNSKKYTQQQVREKIAHQEGKYSWKFVYVGADLTDDTQAQGYGFKTKAYGDKDQIRSVMCKIGSYANDFKVGNIALSALNTRLDCELNEETTLYEKNHNLKINTSGESEITSY